METVCIYRLTGLRTGVQAARREAAQVWTLCRDLHLSAQRHTLWPIQDDFHQAIKGWFTLHSQTVQAILRTFLGTREATRARRVTNPTSRYPYQDRRYYPLLWPACAVSREWGRVVLPMGRGRPSLVFPLDLPHHSGACKLVWRDGYELHGAVATSRAEVAPGQAQATVDLGEIYQAALTTKTCVALIISGRGIRSLGRRHNRAQGQLANKRTRCQRGSRRHRQVQAARRKVSARRRRQTRDLRHKGTRAVIAFCQQQSVGSLVIGKPHGVRNRNRRRHQTQGMSQGEYRQDLAYLTFKSKLSRIESFTGPERGASSQCPTCGWKQQVRGRQWRCLKPECSFQGHREVVGSVTMHPLAFGTKGALPAVGHVATARSCQGPARE